MMSDFNMTSVLSLGKQPIPNLFLSNPEDEAEKYPLTLGFDEQYSLAGLVSNLPSSALYNNNYSYSASASLPMVLHFEKTAKKLEDIFHPTSILEIGSNDGAFIRNFDSDKTLGVEPCSNFAKLTNDLGYDTMAVGWSLDLAKCISSTRKYDLVFASNCITHIDTLQDAFAGLREVVSNNGIVVLEEPWLLNMINNNAYDQIYFEHSYVFSALSVSKLAADVGLELVSIEKIDVHGGSLRYYLAPCSSGLINASVDKIIDEERSDGLESIDTYYEFALRSYKSRDRIHFLFESFREDDDVLLIGYGATAKLTTVFNFCDITKDHVSYVTDTTPDKTGKYIPGTGIQVVPQVDLVDCGVTHAFLGAWNYRDFIVSNEKKFLDDGGKFITHIPELEVFGKL
jgi:methylation protein EvaC